MANYGLKKSNDKSIEKLSEELADNFYENRKIGENDNIILKLIREDSVEEFITFVNKTNTSLTSTINLSIYETNNFLIDIITKNCEDYYDFYYSKKERKYNDII